MWVSFLMFYVLIGEVMTTHTLNLYLSIFIVLPGKGKENTACILLKYLTTLCFEQLDNLDNEHSV